MSLRDKLLKNTTIKTTDILIDSTVFNERDTITTQVPALNIALSGTLDGGLSSGLLQITGPSKHFKSAFTFLIASTYLKTYDDAIILFYDSEFGTPKAYFNSLDIDMNRVVHTPITNIEEFKHDIMSQLEKIDRGDHVIIVVDSIGNLASKKEVEDAIEGKSAADMTRAKALKSLGRMVTPHLTLKNIPMIIVNHTYKTMELYSKDVVGGGTGLYLSSDNIWIVGRQQEKDSKKDLIGYNFVINIEKSRHVKEKSKIPITVLHTGGINKYSGLFEIALEGGFIKEASKGYYTTFDGSDKLRRSQIEALPGFYSDLINNNNFKEYVKQTYKMSEMKLLDDNENDDIK